MKLSTKTVASLLVVTAVAAAVPGLKSQSRKSAVNRNLTNYYRRMTARASFGQRCLVSRRIDLSRCVKKCRLRK